MLLMYILLNEKCYILWLNLHSLVSATVNNAAYLVNLGFKFHSLLILETSTSYSIHFFTQSLSSFRSTCPCHHNLFCCSVNMISSMTFNKFS